ncbi:MAG: sigma 54-interacting transcriptional regulator [Planctomycetota bacterium]|nr:sigma 54-interacting transcriptional regulator [Planctomycetota bacterium]
MESAREAQHPAALRQILTPRGASSLDNIPRVLSEISAVEAIQTFLDLVVETTGAERAFLLQQQQDDSWKCVLARNLDREDLRQPLDKILWPLLDRARQQRESWSCSDVASLPDRDRWDREHLPRTQSVHIVSLGADHFLYIDHRFQALHQGLAEDSMLAIALLAIQYAIARFQQEQLQEIPQATHKSSTGSTVTRSRANGTGDSSVEIIGKHPDLIAMKNLIDRVAVSNAPILITGESGTGKELAARSIHDKSQRSSGPFISENCGAISENLLETELFGCMKGAYTGATSDRPGLFEQAHGGTIFLDEIGDTSPGLQKKLLRVIQEKVLRRVGGQESIKIDVRIVSATNRDLASEVRNQRFREDLFYRLNVINVHLPPLRDRGQDVELLAQHFLNQINSESGTSLQLNTELIGALNGHEWPGNIRELQNEIRRVHALADEDLDPAHLSLRATRQEKANSGQTGLDRVKKAGSLKDAIEQLEAEWIEQALQRFDGHRGQVCQWLGIPKTTLYAKMRRYGLSKD